MKGLFVCCCISAAGSDPGQPPNESLQNKKKKGGCSSHFMILDRSKSSDDMAPLCESLSLKSLTVSQVIIKGPSCYDVIKL